MTTDNRLAAASSASVSTAPDTSSAAPPTKRTSRARKSAGWTPQQGREILAQTARECIAAGLPVVVYRSTRGSIVVELHEHTLDEAGRFVPLVEPPPARAA